jgi:hypothetical protein
VLGFVVQKPFSVTVSQSLLIVTEVRATVLLG